MEETNKYERLFSLREQYDQKKNDLEALVRKINELVSEIRKERCEKENTQA